MTGTGSCDLMAFTGTGSFYSDCDTTTDWAGVTITQDVDLMVQGTACNSIKLSNTTGSILYTLRNVIDFTAAKSLYGWVMGAKKTQWDIKTNGGIGLMIADTTGSFRMWYLAGSDTLPHPGWICHTVRTDQPYNSGSASINLAAIKRVGFRFKTVLTATKVNVWFDALRYGDGVITIKTGSSSSPAVLEDAWAMEDSFDGTKFVNKYGVMEKNQGVYFLQGKLQIGSTTSKDYTYFKDTSQIIMFRDAIVGNSYYDVSIVGNADAQTHTFFGTKSGDSGISGLTVKPAGSAKYTVTATNTNITSLGLYGCSFIDANTISLPTASATREVLNCNFEGGAEVLPDTCTVKSCNFISADLRGSRISGTSFGVTDSKFISCPTGSNVSAVGTYTFSNITYSGCTYDVENSTNGGTVTINCVSGSNPSPAKCVYTGTPIGSTIISNPVSYSFSVENEARNPVTGYEWRLYEADPAPGKYGEELPGTGEEEATASTQTYYYSYAGDVDVVLQVLHGNYEEYILFDKLENKDKSVTVTLKREVNV